MRETISYSECQRKRLESIADKVVAESNKYMNLPIVFRAPLRILTKIQREKKIKKLQKDLNLEASVFEIAVMFESSGDKV